MLLNEKEKECISVFLSNMKQCAEESLLLKWSEFDQAIAILDIYFEDENEYDEDDKRYEEYISFAFKIVRSIGQPPIEVTEDNYFLINYHNFPKDIFLKGKKIN